jgi:hypothetical protein
VLEAPTGRDIDTAFARLAQKPIDALLVGPGPLLDNRRVVVTLAAQGACDLSAARVCRGGRLMSYGTSIPDTHRIVGLYTGRNLKGGATRPPRRRTAL